MNLTDVAAPARPARRKLRPAAPSGGTREVRRFGLVLLVGFGLLGGLLFWWGRTGVAAGLWIFGGLAGAFALGLPRAAAPFHRGWMAVAHVLGRINGAILLALVYVFVVTPLALAFRLIGRDALRLRKRPGAATYWEPKPPPAGARSYFDPY